MLNYSLYTLYTNKPCIYLNKNIDIQLTCDWQEVEHHSIFWLKLLKTLAVFRENAATLKREKTPAVVMGCMGVHTHCASIQQHGCAILTSVAAFQSPAVGKVGLCFLLVAGRMFTWNR